MLYASNYRGSIPLELYIKLQDTFPQGVRESDAQWLQRVKRDPMLGQKMFGTPEFKTELIQAVHRRAMAQAGARRVGHKVAGPALIKLTKPGASNAKTTFDKQYQKEFMIADANQYKYATEAYELLLDQFDALTPPGGSIFWNGINELALARLVDQWNSELGGEVFGQLEATTSARYVNKKFEWDQGGVFQKFFTEVSDRLGHAATGHVTSVVRCGLRFDSIFTVTELPRMLKTIEDQIKAKQNPVVTDLTIVVIEPKHLPNEPVKAFTNNEITQIPIVRPLPKKRINSRGDCTMDGQVSLSPTVQQYWQRRGGKPASRAATKIMQEFGKLIRWP